VPQVETKAQHRGFLPWTAFVRSTRHRLFSVTPESPAQPDEIAVLYGTGLGWVTPAVASGVPAPGVVSATTLIPTVTIGGQGANVVFSGLTPGFIGVYQINIRVPQNASSGDQAAVVSFPPYQACCVGGISTYPVRVDSTPVKLRVR
jgi:uncharacterized protein (TIGR03437 family)